eukprot:GGOE01001841.1.p1 GENE.GGOE01001841.1~~GGOE01001841.1.p1  ORF type:complete len:643 (+),score=105.25 GGOE01001841.1:64-1929(+)
MTADVLSHPNHDHNQTVHSPLTIILRIMRASGLPSCNLPRPGILWVRLSLGHAIWETLPVPISIDPEWNQDVAIQANASDIIEVTLLGSDGRKRWELCAARVATCTMLEKRGREVMLSLLDVVEGRPIVAGTSSLVVGVDLPHQRPLSTPTSRVPICIVSALGLPRASNNGCYVEVWLRGRVKRTSICERIGEPVWNALFHLHLTPKDTVKFAVMSTVGGTFDELLCSVSLKGSRLLTRVGKDMCALLRDNTGRASGSLHLALRAQEASRWVFDFEGPNKETIITVVSAQLMGNGVLDWPFVTVQHGRDLHITRVADSSSIAVWNQRFSIVLDSHTDLRIELKSRSGVVDHTVGVAVLTAAQIQAHEGCEVELDLVHPLHNAEFMGTIRLQIRSARALAVVGPLRGVPDLTLPLVTVAGLPVAGEGGPPVRSLSLPHTMPVQLPITLLGAHDLPQASHCCIQPYATLHLGDVTEKTRTDCLGGCNPVWDERFVLPVRTTDMLEIFLKDDDPQWSSALGRAFVSGRDLLASAGRELWVPLTNCLGSRQVGEVLLAIGRPTDEGMNCAAQSAVVQSAPGQTYIVEYTPPPAAVAPPVRGPARTHEPPLRRQRSTPDVVTPPTR